MAWPPPEVPAPVDVAETASSDEDEPCAHYSSRRRLLRTTYRATIPRTGSSGNAVTSSSTTPTIVARHIGRRSTFRTVQGPGLERRVSAGPRRTINKPGFCRVSCWSAGRQSLSPRVCIPSGQLDMAPEPARDRPPQRAHVGTTRHWMAGRARGWMIRMLSTDGVKPITERLNELGARRGVRLFSCDAPGSPVVYSRGSPSPVNAALTVREAAAIYGRSGNPSG